MSKRGAPDREGGVRSSAAEYLTFALAAGGGNGPLGPSRGGAGTLGPSRGGGPQNVEMRYEDENIWLTQKMMAVLYDVDVRTINYHIKKIFNDSELQASAVIRKFWITAEDGKTYNTRHYDLQMAIAVGFKVNSERAVQFRRWVNRIARDYTIQGWAIDKERLINGGSAITTEYFERLLEQIRSSG